MTTESRFKLCILLILCAEYVCLVRSATLSQSLEPSPAVKGSSSKHTIRCAFTLNGEESFQFLKMYLGPETDLNRQIAGMLTDGTVVWTNNDPDNLKSRGYLMGSKEDSFLSLVLNDTLCTDKDRSYICVLEYLSNPSSSQLDSIQKTTEVLLQAPPLAPTEMQVSPNVENVTEDTEVTFRCSGNVGRPAGSFQWFSFLETDGSGTPMDITDQAVEGSAVEVSGDCTFTRISVLTLKLARTESNERRVMRCRVNHPQGNSDTSACTNPDVDFCRMSPQISVHYPVSVRVDRETVTTLEGSNVTIPCMTQANPPAFLVEWRRQGDNVTMVGDTLTLHEVTLNDTGNYVCTAYNVPAGVTHNHSVTVFLDVDRTTTAPPTTTPEVTTPEFTTKKDESAASAGSGDDTTVIIVVVVVVVVVIVVAIIAVVVFMRRRNRKKEVEEPPLKPFNSHAGINTVATRPDLVTNSYDITPPPYKAEDGLAYAELQVDNKPRSRRPLALDDSRTDYSDVSMPQV